MTDDLNLFGALNNTNSNRDFLSGINSLVPVRVQDVILDKSHIEYSKYGETNCIGAIKYTPIQFELLGDDTTGLPEAYPLDPHIKRYPLKGEIVLLLTAPDAGLSKNNKTANTDSNSQYYISIVSIWNHPNQSAYPPNPNSTVDFGNTKFKETDNVNPLNPFPGDILLQGRQGQSVRFTGTQFSTNPYTDSSNEGKPLTIIANGQQDVGDPTQYITEDINEIPSSIWMTSDHTIPLQQVRTKYFSYRKQPTYSDRYKGAQTLLNTDRLFFNARKESILFSAQESFGATAKSINLDGEEYIGLDAEKIYLGEAALISESQPVLLGNEVERVLETLITEIRDLAKVLQTAKTVDLKALPSVNLRGKLTAAVMDTLLEEINPYGVSPLKSTKVFTE